MFVLIVDFLICRVVFAYRHIIYSAFILGIYFLLTFVGSMIQSRPIYANHLAFQENYSNNYNQAIPVNASDFFLTEQPACNAYFNWVIEKNAEGIPTDAFRVLDQQKNLWITIGTAVICLIVTHILIVFLSQLRSPRPKQGVVNVEGEQASYQRLGAS